MIVKLFGWLKCGFGLHDWSPWRAVFRAPGLWFAENRRCARCGGAGQRWNHGQLPD